jgi:hypothetical protein
MAAVAISRVAYELLPRLSGNPMALIFLTVLAIWLVGFLGMMVRLWQYRVALVKNVVPGRDPFDMRGDLFFDTTRFNPVGKEIHREAMRFLWKFLAVAIGGPIVLGVLGALY